jgi:hypothetical protein
MRCFEVYRTDIILVGVGSVCRVGRFKLGYGLQMTVAKLLTIR